MPNRSSLLSNVPEIGGPWVQWAKLVWVKLVHLDIKSKVLRIFCYLATTWTLENSSTIPLELVFTIHVSFYICDFLVTSIHMDNFIVTLLIYVDFMEDLWNFYWQVECFDIKICWKESIYYFLMLHLWNWMVKSMQVSLLLTPPHWKAHTQKNPKSFKFKDAMGYRMVASNNPKTTHMNTRKPLLSSQTKLLVGFTRSSIWFT